MRDRLIGTTVLVLSIDLDPGESVVAEAGEFAWMTDSIQMSTGTGGGMLNNAVPMSTYTAKGTAGTIAFAARLAGSIVPLDVTNGDEVEQAGRHRISHAIEGWRLHSGRVPLYAHPRRGRAASRNRMAIDQDR